MEMETSKAKELYEKSKTAVVSCHL